MHSHVLLQTQGRRRNRGQDSGDEMVSDIHAGKYMCTEGNIPHNKSLQTAISVINMLRVKHSRTALETSRSKHAFLNSWCSGGTIDKL